MGCSESLFWSMNSATSVSTVPSCIPQTDTPIGITHPWKHIHAAAPLELQLGGTDSMMFGILCGGIW